MLKTEFTARCDVHEYGRKRPTLKAIYFKDDDGDVYIYVYAHGTRREHLGSFYKTYVSGHVDSLTIVPADIWRRVDSLTIVPADIWKGIPIVWSQVNYYLEKY